MAAETSQTLDRGLRVLDALAAADGGLTVSELAARLDVNRTVVHRLVNTLAQRGLVRRDSRGRLHVGLGVLRLAAAAGPVLRDVATPVLRALAEEVGATAHLSVADGEEAVAMVVVEPSWTDFHVAYRVGSRHPLGVGAAGRAIGLAVPATPGPDGERAAYEVSSGELQPGASGLAAPVLGVDGLSASVGIVTLGALDAALVGPRVVAAASALAERLTGAEPAQPDQPGQPGQQD
ncbi:IclR family transcriptional regulator [Nocardioides ferulae]|uniref:IclR family transcriptional regulator n=1 Tax=Nocardioides ferulae TaxID=2340821 RepID=UPI000EB575BE|nr:helix-turn-helix domain-containing protein [Nocardioides ferulae]